MSLTARSIWPVRGRARLIATHMCTPRVTTAARQYPVFSCTVAATGLGLEHDRPPGFIMDNLLAEKKASR
jgi:hypothetical protein